MIKFLKEEPNSSIVKIAEKKKKEVFTLFFIHPCFYLFFIYFKSGNSDRIKIS